MGFNRGINRGGLSGFAGSRAASVLAPGRGEQEAPAERGLLFPPSCHIPGDTGGVGQ